MDSMKQRYYILGIVVAAILIIVVAGLLFTPHKALFTSQSSHIGPANLYPTAQISPGLVATSDFTELTQKSSCGTYSQCHRQTTAAQKNIVRAEYPNCPSPNEIDHIIPLAIGGADDVKNLWCQPALNTWSGQDYGFHTKDKLEAFLAIQVKNGSIAPKDAQDCILADWVSCYQHYFSNIVIGAAHTVADPDTN